MGCTSSAPNVMNSSTAEKSIQSEEEISENQSKDTEEIIYTAGNNTDDIKVLPPCDTLAEHNIQVVRNRSTPSFKTEKDSQEYKHFSEINKKTVSSDTLYKAENPPKLKEVVEKVVELHSSENVIEMQPDSNKPDKTTDKSQKSQGTNDDNNVKENCVLLDKEHSDKEQDKQKDDHPEAAISPSQSESSRATRWEALADIAAELPPSLTVDPLTGQIYTVSK